MGLLALLLPGIPHTTTLQPQTGWVSNAALIFPSFSANLHVQLNHIPIRVPNKVASFWFFGIHTHFSNTSIHHFWWAILGQSPNCIFLVTPLAPPYCDLSASWQDIQWNCDRPAREPASSREEPWKNWSVCIVEPVIIGWSDNSRDNWITSKRSLKYSNGNFVVPYAPFSDRLK